MSKKKKRKKKIKDLEIIYVDNLIFVNEYILIRDDIKKALDIARANRKK